MRLRMAQLWPNLINFTTRFAVKMAKQFQTKTHGTHIHSRVGGHFRSCVREDSEEGKHDKKLWWWDFGVNLSRGYARRRRVG